MKQSCMYQPIYFFTSSFLIASLAWFTAAYISYQPSLHYLLFPLILAGMSSPTISALILFAQARNKNLWKNFCQRLRPTNIKLPFIPIILLFMPCMVLLAIAISLLFGFSPNQFSFSQATLDQALEGKNFLAILLVIALSCSLEEIGWRGYGIESLNERYNLWQTSLIFAVLWSLWHVPAFFIKNGYFQQEVWNLGLLSIVTYFMTLFPVTFLINWVYVKSNRSILVAILSHMTLNFSVALFQIQLGTKTILMLLLLVIAGIVIIRDKNVFIK